jgi:penicillin-binding protein A
VNRQIRRLGLFLVGLFLLMFAQLNYLQVLQADHLANHPGNSRNAVRDFGEPRGAILTSDGRIIAESYRNPSTKSPYKYLRRYPQGGLYGHLTGYFSFTFGSTGLEREYNGVLVGRETALTFERMQDLLKSKVVTANVTTTLNDRLQKAARSALKGRRGSIVALDPRTGGILAMVSYPMYDPNRLTGSDFAATRAAFTELNKTPGNPLLARAYRERYPPGSTFKAITAATGLTTTVVGMTSPIYPQLKALPLRYTTRPLRNFGGSTCGGDLVSVFRISCNTAFAQLGLDLGPERLAKGAADFGFNKTPPLDLSPGAVTSFFPSVEFFNRNDPQLAQSAIGQGEVTATPLEMALVAAGIANKGVIMRPHLKQEVRDSEGVLVEPENKDVWLKAMTPEVAEQVTTMMKEVVNRGTGTRAAISGVQVAAKTGTAQTGRDTAHAWTIAFAPADNPTVAVAVILENQPEVSSATGGRRAAPLAKEVIELALNIQRSTGS